MAYSRRGLRVGRSGNREKSPTSWALPRAGAPPRSSLRSDCAARSSATGKREAEGAAAVGVARRREAAAVRFDDRAADREAHAEALRLGAEERREDVGGRLGNADAAVADRYLDARRPAAAVVTVSVRSPSSAACTASTPLSSRFSSTCSIWMPVQVPAAGRAPGRAAGGCRAGAPRARSSGSTCAPGR